MTQDVSDLISNLSDQIANAARALGKSGDRRKVFTCIYAGKKRVKSKSDIAKITGLDPIRVLQEGARLVAHKVVNPAKVNGETAFEKIPIFSHHKDEILRLAGNKKKLLSYPTKVTPRSNNTPARISITVPRSSPREKFITIDEISNFSKAKKVKNELVMEPVDERKFKNGIKKILGEPGTFTDWGGERNDLFTTRLRLKSKRRKAVFAFKGKGTRGILTLNKMGKKGDQIPRLYGCDAKVYVLQYWNQVDQIIVEEMKMWALTRSVQMNERVYYCIIDGKDTARILKAYPTYFR